MAAFLLQPQQAQTRQRFLRAAALSARNRAAPLLETLTAVENAAKPQWPVNADKAAILGDIAAGLGANDEENRLGRTLLQALCIGIASIAPDGSARPGAKIAAPQFAERIGELLALAYTHHQLRSAPAPQTLKASTEQTRFSAMVKHAYNDMVELRAKGLLTRIIEDGMAV